MPTRLFLVPAALPFFVRGRLPRYSQLGLFRPFLDLLILGYFRSPRRARGTRQSDFEQQDGLVSWTGGQGTEP